MGACAVAAQQLWLGNGRCRHRGRRCFGSFKRLCLMRRRPPAVSARLAFLAGAAELRPPPAVKKAAQVASRLNPSAFMLPTNSRLQPSTLGELPLIRHAVHTVVSSGRGRPPSRLSTRALAAVSCSRARATFSRRAVVCLDARARRRCWAPGRSALFKTAIASHARGAWRRRVEGKDNDSSRARRS